MAHSRNTEDTALNLASMVYDAALDENKWPSFLDAFAQAVGGCSAILRSADLPNSTASFVASVGYDPAWQSAYCNHFVKLDYQIAALNQFKPGEIKTNDQAFKISEQCKTEFYNDYVLPQDKPHALGTLLIKNGSHTLMFAAQRGKLGGAFGEKESQLMGILAPHVARAVQVHRKLSSFAVEKEWALGALDHLRMGVILTNGLGVPLFVNRAAEQLMAQVKAISIFQGGLALSSPDETALLQKLIARAAQGAATGGDMRIALPGRFEFLHCLVTPVSPELAARLDSSIGSGCVALYFSKPGNLTLPPNRLAVLYGLSPAESKLTAKLAEFNTLEQSANGLGISLGTARTQLAAVFAKTGAKTQAELLMLLATGTLAHCMDGNAFER